MAAIIEQAAPADSQPLAGDDVGLFPHVEPAQNDHCRLKPPVSAAVAKPTGLARGVASDSS